MIQNAVKDTVNSVRGITSEDILSAFGLARKRSTFDGLLPAAGILLAGMATGAGIALLLAPKPGQRLRGDIKNKVNELTARIGASAGEIVQDARAAVMQVAGSTGAPPALETGASKRTETAPKPIATGASKPTQNGAPIETHTTRAEAVETGLRALSGTHR